MWEESKLGYLRWYADNMWLFVPVQQKVQSFLASLDGYPFQPGSSLSASGISASFGESVEAEWGSSTKQSSCPWAGTLR